MSLDIGTGVGPTNQLKRPLPTTRPLLTRLQPVQSSNTVAKSRLRSKLLNERNCLGFNSDQDKPQSVRPHQLSPRTSERGGEHGRSLGGAKCRVQKITMKRTGSHVKEAARNRLSPLAPKAKHSNPEINIATKPQKRPKARATHRY